MPELPTAPILLAGALLLAVAGCGGDDTGGGSGEASGGTTSGGPPEYQLCVDLINGYRESIGRAPLARWADAEACSDGEAKSDSETGQAHGAFGACGEQAQDECPGWPGDRESVIEGCLQLMWDEGPGGGHYENMASESSTMGACGYCDSAGGAWAVQNFR